jgi:hypothetical protein
MAGGPLKSEPGRSSLLRSSETGHCGYRHRRHSLPNHFPGGVTGQDDVCLTSDVITWKTLCCLAWGCGRFCGSRSDRRHRWSDPLPPPPHHVLDGIVSLMFLVGAGLALGEAARERKEKSIVEREAVSGRRVVTTAFIVIFLTELGDITQILTANLAAHYHSPLSVGVGALLAQWAVAALAVIGGGVFSGSSTSLPCASPLQ